MIRNFVLLLVVGMFFSMSGCTMNEVMGVKEDKPLHYAPKPDLNTTENHSLRIWSKAAAMADDIGDCTTSILYYTKIVDYFPNTEEGERAQKRLDEISGKSDMLEEEDSL